MTNLVRHVTALAIPCAIAFTHGFASPSQPARPVEYGRAWNAVAQCGECERPRAVFAARLDRHQQIYDGFVRNIYYWVLLSGLGLLVLLKTSRDGFDVLGTKIPFGAIHLLIVVCLLYLWVEFGSTLRFLIYDRMTLWKLAESIEGRLPADGSIALDSLRPMLQGRPFLDGWFRTFLADYTVSWHGEDGAARWVIGAFTTAVWSVAAAMIGLAHAIAWVMLDEVRILWAEKSVATKSAVLLFQGFVAALIAGCYAFFVTIGHGGFLFLGCAVAAGCWIEVLPRVAQRSSGSESRPRATGLPAGSRAPTVMT